MRFALLVLFLMLVLGVLLATQDANFEDVIIALPFLDLQIRGALFWMVAGWFGTGLLLGYLIALPGRISASNRARKAQKELEKIRPSSSPSTSPTMTSTGDAATTQALADQVARSTQGLR
jgi:uncharacterized membrane protein YciS (DUF1049 family)